VQRRPDFDRHDAARSRGAHPSLGPGLALFTAALQVGMSRFWAPIALFVLALLVRAGPWREVLGERVMPVGSDAFYHLRRIVFAVFQYPASLDFDRYLNFPDGAKPIWTPLFDSAIAALLRPLTPPLEQGGQAAIELLAVWVPPLLGASGVVATWWLATRHYGQRVGLVAGVSLALLSGHFWYSQIGFVDHHAAVALLATLLLASALELVTAHQGAARGRALAISLVAGVLAASCLLLWPGCLLHVGLVELGLLGLLLSQSDEREARRLAGVLAAGYLLALALVTPSGLASDWPQWGAFSPVVLSRFQPWLFLVAAGVTGTCAIVWRVPMLGATRRSRALAFAALCGLSLAVSGLLVPELREGAIDAWRWIAKEDAFQARVSESMPLFVDRGRFTVWIAVSRLSFFVFLFPTALVWILWRHRRRPVFARTAMLALWAAGLFAMTLMQKRFFNTASVGVALVVAIGFAELLKTVAGRRRAASWRAAAWLALALCLLPATTSYPRYAANEWRAWRGERLEVSGIYAAARAVVELCSWLRSGTPPTRGWLRQDLAPEYGVLAPWPLGHAIEYLGRRPTLVDNFGDDLGDEAMAFVDRFYASPESDVAESAARRGVRYVVAQRSVGFLGAAPGRHSLARSLFPADGSGTSAVSGRSMMALERHRLVFESSGLLWKDPDAEPVYKVFELVAGAVIAGRAAPGAIVELRAGVSTNRGRRFFYETRAVADADGAYRARVPYANRGGPEGVRVAPLYRLKCGDEVRGVEVLEQAVLTGASVRGPSICTGQP
jgi:dolichyl-diphosphooligosaccharide--protein glycosyltransferase